MESLKWTVAGFLAGTVGAAIWVAIAYFAHAEVYYVALGIGLLVGGAVRWAAKGEVNSGTGIGAAMIAALAIVAAKYAVVGVILYTLNAHTAEVPDETLVANIADYVIETKTKNGEQIVMPQTDEDASLESQYPAEVWADATALWEQTPADKQQEMRAKHLAALHEVYAIGGDLHNQLFLEDLNVYDALWLFLAISAAYRMGSDSEESKEYQAPEKTFDENSIAGDESATSSQGNEPVTNESDATKKEPPHFS